jgi:class 3 adenylate cyclase
MTAGGPPVAYTDSDGLSIAYRRAGAGGPDFVLVLPTLGTIEMLWEPPCDRLALGVMEFARVICFDRRGTGLSSPTSHPATLEEQLDDLDAVLDACRASRVTLYSEGEGAMLALLYAATRPERVARLILLHGMARITAAEGYEWPWSAEERRKHLIEPTLAGWGSGATAELLAPVLSSKEPRLAGWWARWERITGAPAYFRKILELNGEMDVRAILGQVGVPTLILNRPESAAVDDRHAEYLAERIPGAELRQLPGRDSVSFADGFEAQLEVMRAFVTGDAPSAPKRTRSLATVLFTDIVGSTERAAATGDRGWRDVLEEHDELSRRIVSAHEGAAIKSTGDGLLATFDGPARGVQAAVELCEAVRELGLELRAGLHTGEVELIGDDIGGMAVHIGARVGAHAGEGEVLASSTVKDLVVGAGIEFEPAGEHRLKGVPGEWQLYRVTAVA